jgi:hypothetical protein
MSSAPNELITQDQFVRLDVHLRCPITQAIFLDPVIGLDGITYEKEALVTFIKSNNTEGPGKTFRLKSKHLELVRPAITSPVNKLPLEAFVPNFSMKILVAEYLKENPHRLPEQYVLEVLDPVEKIVDNIYNKMLTEDNVDDVLYQDIGRIGLSMLISKLGTYFKNADLDDFIKFGNWNMILNDGLDNSLDLDEQLEMSPLDIALAVVSKDKLVSLIKAVIVNVLQCNKPIRDNYTLPHLICAHRSDPEEIELIMTNVPELDFDTAHVHSNKTLPCSNNMERRGYYPIHMALGAKHNKIVDLLRTKTKIVDGQITPYHTLTAEGLTMKNIAIDHFNEDYEKKLDEEIQNKNSLKIFVKTLTAKTVVLNCSPMDNFYGVKQHMFRKEGIPPEQNRLVYAGKAMEDTDTLASKDVKEEQIFHSILRLRGG